MTEQELAREIIKLRKALTTVEALIRDTCEDFGRANLKHEADSEYAGPVSETRKEQMTAALETAREALRRV